MEEEEKKEPVVYASPVKRAWAWVGVVYMVILVLLVTYALAKGAFLEGIWPLMLCPALAGLGATAILRHRAGQQVRGGLAACVLMVAVCAGLILLNLAAGIPILIRNF